MWQCIKPVPFVLFETSIKRLIVQSNGIQIPILFCKGSRRNGFLLRLKSPGLRKYCLSLVQTKNKTFFFYNRNNRTVIRTDQIKRLSFMIEIKDSTNDMFLRTFLRPILHRVTILSLHFLVCHHISLEFHNLTLMKFSKSVWTLL